jgi:hypothetical protein
MARLRPTLLKLVLPIAVGWAPLVLLAVRQDPEIPPDYATAHFSDPVSGMVESVNAGKLNLEFQSGQGYLRSVLSALQVKSDTQMLVFSKTSLQTAYISPQSPRAVYFGQAAYVAWIPGAPNIEMIGIDPKSGPVFYTLVNRAGSKPLFTRQGIDCFQCHDSPMTGQVLGVMSRSVYAGVDGDLRLANGSFMTTATSPIKERWGGWYVTGTSGSQRHMGNEPARGDDQNSTIDTARGTNVTDLNRYFDTSRYLTPHSDIVALMVVEQQMEIQNLVTKAADETRAALKYAATLRTLHWEEPHIQAGIAERVTHTCEPLVQALLCSGEPALTSPLVGTAGFAAQFSESAPADRLGRRLSELDLKTRLLRYPCSPMIYSASFQGMPREAKDQVYKRLREVLSGKDQTAAYEHLSATDRSNISTILRDTLPGF